MLINKLKKIYMIGIKGVGMTMLAQYLAAQGVEVAGSDTEEKFMTDAVLIKAGIKVMAGWREENIPSDAELIIYSTAYNEKNIEVAFAKKSGIKTVTYAQALGGVFNEKYGIAVVGSHGKTTTSAWLGFVMKESGLEPSVMVGASVPQFSGTSLSGRSDYLVIEADEYQNKLEYFYPKAALLNNIDYDHPDFFPTKEDYCQAFVEFIKKIPARGWLVVNYDDEEIRKIAQVNCRAKIITYAINEAADYVAYDIKETGERQYFKVKFGSENSDEDDFNQAGAARSDDLGDFSISLSGRYNISNALAVIASSIELGIGLADIRGGLQDFNGTARRIQTLGKFNGAIIIDDYAHHPTEIKATLAGLRERYKGKKIKVVFHPHTYTRTKALINDFAQSFFNADEVIVLDIYGSAREVQGGVSSGELVEKIKQAKNWPVAPINIATLKEAEEYLRKKIERDDIVILMGAGDVFRIGENLVKS
jgi:UDP-N-acetylmuramate--alanine ligase